MSDNTSENEDYERRQRGRPPKSEARKFIAFRVDSGTGGKIEHLEKVENCSKTEVIVNAVGSSYSKRLLENALNITFPLIKEVFPKAKIQGCYPGLRTSAEIDENNIRIPTDEVVFFINLNVVTEKEEKRMCKAGFMSPNPMTIEAKIEGSRTVRLEIVKPITDDRASKMNKEFLKFVFDLSSKYDLNLKTENFGRLFSQTSFGFETVVYHENDFKSRLKKKLKSLESALDELSKKPKENHAVVDEQKDQPDVHA